MNHEKSVIVTGAVTGEHLRACRAILQLNQTEFAAKLGCAVATLHRLETRSGRIKSMVDTEAAIATALKAEGFVLLECGVIWGQGTENAT